MPKDSKILDVSERAATLKKAGFSTAVTLVIILLSTPGFYNFFFDTKGEKPVLRQYEHKPLQK